MDQILQIIINDEMVLHFAFWGAVGAVVNVILTLYAEQTGKIEEERRLFGARKPSFWLIAYQFFASACIGAISAIVANKATAVAIIVGFFAQQVGLILIRFTQTKSFSVAINEGITKVISTYSKDIIKIDDKTDKKPDQN